MLFEYKLPGEILSPLNFNFNFSFNTTFKYGDQKKKNGDHM